MCVCGCAVSFVFETLSHWMFSEANGDPMHFVIHLTFAHFSPNHSSLLSVSLPLFEEKTKQSRIFRHWNEWTFHGWMSVKWVSILNCLLKNNPHLSSFVLVYDSQSASLASSILLLKHFHCVCCSSEKCGNGSQMMASLSLSNSNSKTKANRIVVLFLYDSETRRLNFNRN